MKTSENGLLRIGVFYDGTYFAHVSNYYAFAHERKSRISITGLHEFIREEVSREEGLDKRYCKVVDAHYFRGRFSAKAIENQNLYKERQFDDVLIREGVTVHFMPLFQDQDGGMKEKGIDVWYALEAFDLAVQRRFEVTVLVTGDGDFLPLVRKLNAIGTRVMLLAWDFEYVREGKPCSTRTSQSLISEVTYPIMMSDAIDSRNDDPSIDHLFVPRALEVPLDGGSASLGAVGETQQGTIATLSSEKGFGFIKPESGDTNLFFHMSWLEGCALSQLAVGAPVQFKVGSSDKGPVATDVQLVDP